MGKNPSIMADESAKRAAQEFLAAKLSEEGQLYENKVDLEAALALGPKVWKKLADTVIANCREWNAVTGEQSLTCKETVLDDLHIRCAGRELTRCLSTTIPERASSPSRTPPAPKTSPTLFFA